MERTEEAVEKRQEQNAKDRRESREKARTESKRIEGQVPAATRVIQDALVAAC